MGIQRTTRAFTLIELLVVMSIIVALLAMLQPAASHALATARRLECKSHLHQISIGALAFAQDHGGMLPPSNIQDPNHVYLVSANARHGELGGANKSTLWGHLVDQEYISKKDMNDVASAVFYCPARDPWDRYGYYGAAAPNLTGSLGWPNWYATMGPWGVVEISYMSRGNIKRLSQVTPQARIYGTDVFWDDSYRRNGSPQGFTADYGDLGHKGYCNFLLYDGAVGEYVDDRELLRNAGFHGVGGLTGLSYLEAEL